MEHKLGMNCMASGSVLIRIRLDKGGYVPGEKIRIWASIDNQSGAMLKSTQAVLTEVSQRTPQLAHPQCTIYVVYLHIIRRNKPEALVLKNIADKIKIS